MNIWRQIIRSKENKLITLKCTTRVDGRRPVYLLGMVEMNKQREELTEGWILIISGAPLVPDGLFCNKIHVDRLRLSCEQRKAILDKSPFKDGFVYLYGGNFFVGRCLKSPWCQQQKLDILKLLCDTLDKYEVNVDLQNVVPFTSDQLPLIIRSRVGKNRCLPQLHGCHGNEHCPPPYQKKEGIPEKFNFRGGPFECKVELECPAVHGAYHVELYFLQTFICRENVKDAKNRRRITRILDQDNVYVAPSFMETTLPTYYKRIDKATISLKTFFVPDYNNKEDRQILDSYLIERVEYWGIARLLINGDWDGVTMGRLIEWQVGEGPDEIRENEEKGRKCGSPSKYNVYENSPSISLSPSKSSYSTNPQQYRYCNIPTRLDLVEIFLKG